MARTALAGERLPRFPLLSIILLIFVSVAWVSPAVSAPVQVYGIRHWTGAEHTRVVLDLSARPLFRERRTADPPVVTLEIDNAVLAAGLGNQMVLDGRLREVQVEAPAGAPARVSFLLEGKRAVKVFTLGPAQGKPHRVVVDILGARLAVTSGASTAPAPAAAAGAPAEPTPTPPAVSPTAPSVNDTAITTTAVVPSDAPAVTSAPVGPAIDAGPPVAAKSTPAVSTPVPATPRIEPKTRSRPWIVVIDPGHGGEDPGARGPGGVLEKDLCLALGRALAADLNRRPGIQAHLTRDKDFFIPLRRRTRIAAEKEADLFVSVHANASRNKSAHGTEVYFLSLRGASDAGAREVAMRENASDLVAGVPPTAQDEIEEILVDLMRTKVLERSSELASTVIDGLQADQRLVLRGVKQAGFDVLKTASMPSILIETAFISHSKEAKLMKTKAFQQRFGSLVGGALADYLTRAGAVDVVPVEAGATDPPAAASARPAGN